MSQDLFYLFLNKLKAALQKGKLICAATIKVFNSTDKCIKKPFGQCFKIKQISIQNVMMMMIITIVTIIIVIIIIVIMMMMMIQLLLLLLLLLLLNKQTNVHFKCDDDNNNNNNNSNYCCCCCNFYCTVTFNYLNLN